MRGDFSYTLMYMSTSREASLSVIAEIARRMKTDLVHENGDDPDESQSDLMCFTVGVRDSQQKFLVYHGAGPESARRCAYWTMLFLSCDEIFQVADARMMQIQDEDTDKPLVPKSWEQEEHEFWERHPELQPGSIGEAWARGERDGVQECIQISRYPRSGPPTIASYDYVRTGRQIVWGRVWNQPTEKHGGAIKDYIDEARRKRKEVQPIIDEMLEKTHADMSREGFRSASERRYWTDRGMAKYVSGLEGVMFVNYLSHIRSLPDVIFRDGEAMSA